ncbi:MAG: IclR family transcriptional regulator [Chloroflexi bacterium]|nr:IclR family transcriptional regulator [Chloroflexota bacterium]MCL5074729.1 IclR family transcriptional regulator [Chloroflexota bacterium]
MITSVRPTLRKSKSIQSVARACAVLRAFNIEEPELGITELSKIVGLTPGSVFRLVASLESQGLLEQNPQTGKYRLGFDLFILGSIVLSRMRLGREIRPQMEQLAKESGESVNLGVLHQGQVVYVQKVESTQPIRAIFQVGGSVPAYCTALGKVLLACLTEDDLSKIIQKRGLTAYTPQTITSLEELKRELCLIRSQGFALEVEGFNIGLSSLGAPVRDYTGRVIAAVAIYGPTQRIVSDRLPELQKLVMETAKTISYQLGYFSADINGLLDWS